MLMNARKSKQHSSISPPSAVSAGLSNRFDTGLRAEEQLHQETVTRVVQPEIEAAQRLLARIAARIVTQRRRNER